MSRVLAALSILAVVGAALWAGPSQADADGAEAQALAIVDEILNDADLPSAIWGIEIRDARDGRLVLSRNGDKNLLPASNLKLFTTAAALDRLGPDFRYTTRLYHLGDVSADGTLTGDLVIVGSGDPTFGSEGMGDPLREWAAALAEAGVRRVTGRIVGDDDVFEDARYGEGWDVTHIATENYAPPAGGLVWGDNLVSIRIAGTSPGQAPQFESNPPGFATVVGDVVTRSGGGRLDVERTLGTDEFVLRGGVPSGYRGTIRVPVANPTLFAVHAFALRLEEAGIDVSRATRVDIDDTDRKPATADAEPLRAYVSPTLDEIVDRINRESDNLYAEQVFRTLGGGDTDTAEDRVQAFVTSTGVDGSDLYIADGSGLSRKDMVSPAALASVLRAMRRHPASRSFLQSLPEGGASGSTLRNRLGGISVKAKTGSLLAVRCLAGYVDGAGGTPYVFVLMANNYTASGGRIAGAQDAIVRALATGQRVPADE
ncbi:D-alanyl-D-alanine carboxypeptidase/D-alanyl-D-alanine-endopeptidase [Rubrivirga sp. IMCC45206]|uniref:D-alanyl-D-alanine carboxypeptidase/D-alanyl-D-alanine endopeptidase n=1 Tax=Rubrivirga sp. IMCC45206 TaxID=3391614 RepID=UPI00398FEB06